MVRHVRRVVKRHASRQQCIGGQDVGVFDELDALPTSAGADPASDEDLEVTVAVVSSWGREQVRGEVESVVDDDESPAHRGREITTVLHLVEHAVVLAGDVVKHPAVCPGTERIREEPHVIRRYFVRDRVLL